MSTTVKKWRLYCEDDDRCEFVWQVDAPTQCPTNAEHTVRENSVDFVATVDKTKRINTRNSPFQVNSCNFYLVDTSDGNVSIVLPPATGKNATRALYFVKEGAENTISISPSNGETIDAASDAKTISTDRGFAKLVSNGSDGWISISALDTDGSVEDEQIDEKTPSASETWIFRDVRANSLNCGTNVAGAWTTRTFNEVLRDSGADVQMFDSSNTFVVGQGSYHVHAECVFYKTDFTRVRLRNVTDSSNAAVSLNAYAGVANEASCTVVVDDVIVVPSAAAKTFRLEYFCTKAQTNNGLGRANGTGDEEVYAIVRFVKLE